MARISIYIGRHLCTAPRPIKEADALAAAGHEVTVSGLWFDPRLVARDQALLKGRPWRFQPYADCRPGNAIRELRWVFLRTRHRLADNRFRRMGSISPDLFGYATSRMFAHARQHRCDLAIFHSEGGLWVARQLRLTGRRVGVDFEDWFSEDLPAEVRATRPLATLRELESAALRSGHYVLTTSRALASALASAYSVEPPTVIYNIFPASAATPPPAAVGPVRLHWFSQTLGPGRGLETLFTVLPRLPGDWHLNLLADDPGQFSAKLIAHLPAALHSRVDFQPTVPNAELPTRIAAHHIGLALETPSIPNRNLTITNKLFQYLEAGLAVVASNTAGHTEALAAAPAAGELFTADDPDSLCSALSRLILDPGHLAAARQAACHASATVLSYERQLPLYASLAARALAA